jgi:hypothetical protein
MIRHVQSIRAHGHQRDRGLTVQKAADRRRHVLIDRFMHELVPEHNPVGSFTEELSVEHVAELPVHLGRRPSGDSGEMAGDTQPSTADPHSFASPPAGTAGGERRDH